jgi:hypothetical protein
MRMASKSAIVFCISNGLERNKVFLRFLLSRQLPTISFQCQFYVSQWPRAYALRNVPSEFFSVASAAVSAVLATAFLSPLPRWPSAFSPRS